MCLSGGFENLRESPKSKMTNSLDLSWACKMSYAGCNLTQNVSNER